MAKKVDSVQFVKERFEEAEDWSVLRQIQINRSFYNSKQWISYDRVNRTVYVPEIRPGERRLTFNKIKPAILTLLSKLCKNRVKLEVKPNTNDVERIEVAKGGYKYLQYQWDEDDITRKVRRLKFLMLIDGMPSLKVFVDRAQGEDIEIDEGMLSEMDVPAPPKTGKIVTRVIDQFAIYYGPAESSEEIPWVIERWPTDVDEIEEEWGVKVAPEDNIIMRNTFNPDPAGVKPRMYRNHAMVYDYWEFPCAKYPKGRRIVTAGGKELESTDDPGESPYIFFPATPIAGSAIATGVVTDMTTPQKSYNIKRTAEAKILEEMGNPVWIKPAGSVDDEDLTNEVGAIIEYNPVGTSEPKRVQGATVDGGWQNAMERDRADMEDISGAHEISQGATPKGNHTLGGLQLQVEQDETKLALLVQSYEDGMKQWGEKVLRLVQKHFPEEQQLSIVGENGEIEAFTFSGADLSGGEVVDVVPGSSMPTLKVVQDEKIMAMYGAGLFNDPRTGAPDARRVVRMLGESIAHQYFDDTEQDENKALMEQRQWQQAFGDPETAQMLIEYVMQSQVYQMQVQQLQVQGLDPAIAGDPPQPSVKLPIVRDFYDHETHIAAHNRFRKTDDYDQLPPELQSIIDQHVAEHEQALMAPQMQQQQQQQQQQAEQSQRQQQQAELQWQQQEATKMQDHYRRLEETAMKGDMALRQATMKGRG